MTTRSRPAAVNLILDLLALGLQHMITLIHFALTLFPAYFGAFAFTSVVDVDLN